MKIDIQFDTPQETNNPNPNEYYVVPFTIVGGAYVSKARIVAASQQRGGMREIEQQILTELSAFLQVQLYGRVISDEPKSTGSDKSQRDSKASEAFRRLDNKYQQDEAGGSGRPFVEHDPTITEAQKKAEGYVEPGPQTVRD